ncbi:hypothetical protein HG530_004581 [Fusarium avenaceum]|nr:hypothetical protein HG530_004581 [Fusarium avenaceum]
MTWFFSSSDTSISWILSAISGGFIDRGYTLGAVVQSSTGRAILRAHGRRARNDGARCLVVRTCLGDGSIGGSFDESEELIFGSEKFGIDLLEKREVSNKLFGERSNSIGEVRNRRENVDGLVGTADRVSAGTRAAHVRSASRRIRASLANWLRPAVRRVLRCGRLGRLHRERRERPVTPSLPPTSDSRGPANSEKPHPDDGGFLI